MLLSYWVKFGKRNVNICRRFFLRANKFAIFTFSLYVRMIAMTFKINISLNNMQRSQLEGLINM